MITLKRLERAFGSPAREWAGKCYAVACAASKLIKDSVPIYGHYLGKVNPKSMFFKSSQAGFIQHGWVRLSDGDVLDPTRWVFENKKPYLYTGPDDDYDEGGNKFRTMMLGACPEFDPFEETMIITSSVLASEPWNFVEHTLGLDNVMEVEYEPGTVNKQQLMWLANLDPHKMKGHTKAIYGMLKKLNLESLIPIDNRRAAEEGRI